MTQRIGALRDHPDSAHSKPLSEYVTIGLASLRLFGSRRAVALRRAVASGELDVYGTARRVRWTEALAWAQRQRVRPPDRGHAASVVDTAIRRARSRAQSTPTNTKRPLASQTAGALHGADDATSTM